MKTKLPILGTLILLAGLMLSAPADAQAGRLRAVIKNNGADSTNNIKVNKSSSTTVVQGNKNLFSTSVYSVAKTGGNTQKGNTGGTNNLTTGDAYSSVYVSNYGGINYAHIGCCDHGECDDHDPKPTPSPSPTPPDCEEVEDFAGAVENVDQGTLKTGAAITDPTRTDAQAATGAPDGSFFSIGDEGWIELALPNGVPTEAGNLLSLHEVTNGRDTYPEEKAMVEASEDGSTWHNVGEASNQDSDDGEGVTLLDLSGLPIDTVNYVRVTDSTDYGLHNDEADGYDLDAIDARYASCEEVAV